MEYNWVELDKRENKRGVRVLRCAATLNESYYDSLTYQLTHSLHPPLFLVLEKIVVGSTMTTPDKANSGDQRIEPVHNLGNISLIIVVHLPSPHCGTYWVRRQMVEVWRMNREA